MAFAARKSLTKSRQFVLYFSLNSYRNRLAIYPIKG